MPPILLSILPGLLTGWLTGMLVNYVSDVFPLRRALVQPFCLHCEAEQSWSAYLLYPARCEACGSRRSRRVWAVAAIYAALGAWLFAAPPERLGVVLGIFWLAYFGVIMVIDLEHRLIMHPVSLFGMLAAMFTGWQLHGWFATLAGGLAGFGIMLFIYFLGLLMVRLVNRRRGQPIGDDEGIGFGDVTLSAVIGLLLGWPGVAGGLIIGVLLGGAASIVVLLAAVVRQKYHPGLSLAYGPYLALAAIYLLYL